MPSSLKQVIDVYNQVWKLDEPLTEEDLEGARQVAVLLEYDAPQLKQACEWLARWHPARKDLLAWSSTAQGLASWQLDSQVRAVLDAMAGHLDGRSFRIVLDRWTYAAQLDAVKSSSELRLSPSFDSLEAKTAAEHARALVDSGHRTYSSSSAGLLLPLAKGHTADSERVPVPSGVFPALDALVVLFNAHRRSGAHPEQAVSGGRFHLARTAGEYQFKCASCLAVLAGDLF